MHTLFEGKPWQLTLVKLGIVAFIGLSIIDLYLSIKINREILKKQQ